MHILRPHFTQEEKDWNELSCLPKVTQLSSDSSKIQTQVFSWLVPCSLHYSMLPPSKVVADSSLPAPLTGPLSTLLNRVAVSCRSVLQHGIFHSCHHLENALQISKIQRRPDGQVFTCRAHSRSMPLVCRVLLCDKPRDCQVSGVGVTIRNRVLEEIQLAEIQTFLSWWQRR